jgi:hypothetical protein
MFDVKKTGEMYTAAFISTSELHAPIIMCNSVNSRLYDSHWFITIQNWIEEGAACRYSPLVYKTKDKYHTNVSLE